MNHYVIDTGSENTGSFGWAKATFSDKRSVIIGGRSLSSALQYMKADLEKGPISIGIECPTYIELNKGNRTKGRIIDKGTPWSVGSGATTLAIGITDMLHLLKELRESCPAVKCRQLTAIELIEESTPNTIWFYEGFVSGKKAKGTGSTTANKHVHDAITILLELEVALGPDKDSASVHHSDHEQKHSLLIANGARFPNLFAEGESIRESPLVIKPSQARWEGVKWTDVTGLEESPV